MVSLSRRLLPVLQLTRMALVFTAIADSQCGLFLRWAGGDLQTQFRVDQFLLMILVSFGLYGFGMSLNDIIDRRRDAQIAAGRPLPSGRIGVITAHVICFLLIGCALAAGAAYARLMDHWLLSFLLVIGTGLLITFYDLAGKYLVAPGLLSLGLIRFCHAVIPSPELPVLWHPLLLLNHVAILSTVAYAWEEKRPALTRLHWWGVLGGLGLFDALLISVVAWRRYDGSIVEALRLRVGLLLPAAAVLLFIAQAYRIRKKSPTRRAAGQKLMLTGLLWLIFYDASFVGVYVSPLVGIVLLGLAPVAYLAVQLMRWWSQMLVVSQRPQFRRAVSAEEKKMTR